VGLTLYMWNILHIQSRTWLCTLAPLNEYVSTFTPLAKSAWDDKEQPAMYDENLEGSKKTRSMTKEFMKQIVCFGPHGPHATIRRYV
jgi:hypothetical protein